MRKLTIVLLVLIFVVPAYCAEVGTMHMLDTLATEKIVGAISVVSIDETDKTEGEIYVNDEEIEVNAGTLIHLDGKLAKLSDLKEDMLVTVECSVAAARKTAKSIEARSPAPVGK